MANDSGPELAPVLGTKPRLLVIDDHPESRFLVSKTLLRKFPNAIVSECVAAEPALDLLRRGQIDVVICHRTFEQDPASLVRILRTGSPDVPILMMSGIDRTDAAVAAGANGFLITDRWLLVGAEVAKLLGAQRKERI